MERDFPSHCSNKIYCFNKSAIPLGDLGLSRNQTYLSMRAHVSVSARIISTHVAHKKQLLQSSDSKIPSGLGWIPYHIDGMESRLKSARTQRQSPIQSELSAIAETTSLEPAAFNFSLQFFPPFLFIFFWRSCHAHVPADYRRHGADSHRSPR